MTSRMAASLLEMDDIPDGSDDERLSDGSDIDEAEYYTEPTQASIQEDDQTDSEDQDEDSDAHDLEAQEASSSKAKRKKKDER